mmetsp:Transcript_15888/g.21013  ORF Transcript_15888/g.21013 Transcript_15888/m.21013 type:complete len:304 (-) Transcript_15888:307-1218(-)|eukprot:CAMPEP_0117790388 /NCGR_PEP_ID=MMETSP0948-20121206/8219_1 /TAXON_ID=44440 /ORGANISM="Chattonella subsalsa, Strain CCMP2191" /LENGTH=303 /DNA_ID=CAMNT_0005620215 /DNA_START=30 /DNA_END=941 /DNA_ORIENTATION=+
MDETLKSLAKNAGSKKNSLELLNYIRTNKVRRPDLVLEYGKGLLSYGSSLGDELWTIHEQIFQAALDFGETEISQQSLTALEKQFPGSSRVKRLSGMFQESKENYDAAETIYKALLQENPANTLVTKRLIAIQLAKGKTAAAVKLLNAYLTESPADTSAWQKLAEIHMSISNYEAAAFCYEELVLAEPAMASHHLRLGELYYTLGEGLGGSGSLEQFRLARKHFSRAIELSKPGLNPRAHMGLCMTAAAYASCKGAKGDLEINAALHELGKDTLAEAYSAAGQKNLGNITASILAAQAEGLSR